jgi:hypothetical protein
MTHNQHSKNFCVIDVKILVGVKGLGHVPRPRNFYFENKFSSEDCLAIRQLAESLAVLTFDLFRSKFQIFTA